MANVYITDEMYEAICFAFGQVESELEGSGEDGYAEKANFCLNQETKFIFKYKKSYYLKEARKALVNTGKPFDKEHVILVAKELSKNDAFFKQYEEKFGTIFVQ